MSSGEYVGWGDLRKLEQELEKHETTAVTTAVKAPVETPDDTPVTAPVETAVATAASNHQRTAVARPVTAPVETPVTTPVDGAVEDTPSRPAYQSLDATHTPSESQIYSVMYRHTISRGVAQRRFRTTELMAETGIRGDHTVRRAIKGLIEKRSIAVTRFEHGDPHGAVYRVSGPKEIFAARRRDGIEIDEVTKKITKGPVATAVRGPVATDASTAASTAVATAPATPVTATGVTAVTVTGVHESWKSHDDDSLALAIRRLAPGDSAEGVARARTQIIELVVAAIDRAGARAKEPPAAAAYAVECVRRALEPREQAERRERGKSVARADEPPQRVRSAEETLLLAKAVAREIRKDNPGIDADEVRRRMGIWCAEESISPMVIDEALN